MLNILRSFTTHLEGQTDDKEEIMRTSNVSIALAGCINAGRPVLLVGEPGVGKTELGKAAAAAAGADIIVSHPVVNDPTDAKGMPWPDPKNQCANFLPFGHLARALRAKKKTVWFLDDLGQATPAVQASFMQLLLERAINDHVLPDCITFIAATNGREHRAGVQGILSPVKSRFVSIIKVEAFYEDWRLWAYQSGSIRPEVVGFLNLRGRTNPEDQLFNKFTATADIVNCPSPRTWEHVSQILDMDLPEVVTDELLTGAVGEAAAREFCGFLKLSRDLPSPDAVIVDPTKARIPQNPSSLYALSSALAARATKKNCGQIFKYGLRMYAEGHADIAALLVHDCANKTPGVRDTREYRDLILTELGQIMTA